MFWGGLPWHISNVPSEIRGMLFLATSILPSSIEHHRMNDTSLAVLDVGGGGIAPHGVHRDLDPPAT